MLKISAISFLAFVELLQRRKLPHINLDLTGDFHRCSCIYNQMNENVMKKASDRLSMIKTRSRQCIAARMRLLNRVVTNIYDSALSPFGVKLNQMSILMVVYLEGEIGYEALCKRLKMEKSTASRNIERLKKKGWLAAVSVAGERRKHLKVTMAGEDLLEKVHNAWEGSQIRATELLGKEGTEVICNIANGIWKKDKAS